MAVTVEERYESRPLVQGDEPGCTLRYTIEGTADEAEASWALATTAPTIYRGLVRKSYEVTPAHVDEDDPDHSSWEGTVHYAKAERARPKTGDSSFSFDIGGATQLMMFSKQTVGAYGTGPDGGAAGVNDFKQAIGVSGPETIEGVEVYVPVYNFTETWWLDNEYVTASYKAGLFRLAAAPVNGAAFRGFEPGEVLFMGASGSQRGDEDWEITFRFSASPNAYGLVVGGIAGISKRGWEYLWVRSKPGPSGKEVLPIPRAVYVERVYDYGDFRLLGIGI
jgi:hypothetical protein